MYIGAHLSVAGGYDKTVAYAQQVGAECMQVFAKSPRQWKSRPIDVEAANDFALKRAEEGLGPLFTHTAYLINLSTSDETLRARSIEALADELSRGCVLDAAGVVTHVGNDPDDDPAAAARRAGESIAAAFELSECAPGATRLLLENTAGAGRSFGSSFEQLGAIFGAVPPDIRDCLGVCLDTCHAHAFGVDLSDETAWAAVVDAIEDACGTAALRLIHANDCKFERGSKRDRHEWIGDGFLGSDAFQAMLCEPRLATVSAVTEMPGDVPKKDIENISRLKRLREACASAAD